MSRPKTHQERVKYGVSQMIQVTHQTSQQLSSSIDLTQTNSKKRRLTESSSNHTHWNKIKRVGNYAQISQHPGTNSARKHATTHAPAPLIQASHQTSQQLSSSIGVYAQIPQRPVTTSASTHAPAQVIIRDQSGTMPVPANPFANRDANKRIFLGLKQGAATSHHTIVSVLVHLLSISFRKLCIYRCWCR